MVSNASDDLPEPLSPVNTTSASRGISRSTFLRLCSRAPRTWMVLWGSPAGGLLTIFAMSPVLFRSRAASMAPRRYTQAAQEAQGRTQGLLPATVSSGSPAAPLSTHGGARLERKNPIRAAVCRGGWQRRICGCLSQSAMTGNAAGVTNAQLAPYAALLCLARGRESGQGHKPERPPSARSQSSYLRYAAGLPPRL